MYLEIFPTTHTIPNPQQITIVAAKIVSKVNKSISSIEILK